MKISIIIPNYNSGDILINNLPSILSTGADEIIIVDDKSTDKSVEIIKNYVSSTDNRDNVKILENERNLGFSSTVDKGVEAASGDIVVLLNTDVLPEKDFLGALIIHFDDPKVFAVGCMDKSVEKSGTILRGRGIGKWDKGFLVHGRGEVDKTNTLWVSCGSGAFRKNLWQKLGGLDPIFNPFYWEDIDISYRALKAGYRILFEPRSTVIHKHEEGVIRQRYSPFFIKTIAYRNQFLFVWKNIADKNYLAEHVLWLPYHFLTRLISGDLAFFLGFIKAFGHVPVIIKKRKEPNSVKSDKEVLTEFSSA